MCARASVYCETFGGVTEPLRKAVGYLASRATSKLDRTVYGMSRLSTKSFYLHHIQRLALAAIVGNIKGVRKSIHPEAQDGRLVAGATDACSPM